MNATENKTFTTVKATAEYLYSQLYWKEGNESKVFLRGDCKPWCKDAVRITGENSFNLDYCYDIANIAAGFLTDHDNPEDRDSLFGDRAPEPDIYTADLLNWLSAGLGHVELVNDVIDEIGSSDTDLLNLLQQAQARQREKAVLLLWDYLNDNIVTKGE